MNVAGHAGDERHLDKDQRLVRHPRVKKGKAAAVGFEPIFQIGPAANLVHRLVRDQLFEQGRGRFPADPLQLEKADVEPIGEQTLQIVFEAAQQRIARAEIHQFGAAIDQKLDALGQRIELAHQGDAWRFEGRAQRPLGGVAFDRPRGGRQRRTAAFDRLMVDLELAGQDLPEALAPALVEQ